MPEGGDVSRKNRLLLLILVIFFGWMGGHRFYAGKVGTALLMLFTMGGFGIWWFIDFIMIALGAFADKDEMVVSRWL